MTVQLLVGSLLLFTGKTCAEIWYLVTLYALTISGIIYLYSIDLSLAHQSFLSCVGLDCAGGRQ